MSKYNYLALVWLQLTFCTYCPVSLATDLSGAITADTLKKADSPFVVTGNISLAAARTLTIEAGVTIKFNTGLNFLINGELQAIGATSDSIRFTSNQGTPGSGDWNGVSFSSTGSGSLQYGVVEYSASGITVSGSGPSIRNCRIHSNTNGVDCLGSATPLIQSNIFEGNSNTAIRCNQASPTIKGNQICGNVAVSAAILCENSAPQISLNQLYGNSNAGIDCIVGANPNIWHNTIASNDLGITISDSSAPVVNGNIVVTNTNIGIAINDAEANPSIKHNNVWSNSVADYFGAPAGIGNLSGTNANGDPSDANFNISANPQFVNSAAGDYNLLVASTCINAGDPANPAGVSVAGSAPDIGALEYDGAVPVELTSFSFANGLLHWATASETNNFGFEVQRGRKHEGPFQPVGFVQGAGTTVVPQTYSFRDSMQIGLRYYRLKQVDLDGTFVLSNPIRGSYELPQQLSLSANFPNPFNPTTTIIFTLPELESGNAGKAELAIYNVSGQLVNLLVNEPKPPGFYQFQWRGVDNSGRPLASGFYIYRLRYGEWSLTRRMLLLQ